MGHKFGLLPVLSLSVPMMLLMFAQLNVTLGVLGLVLLRQVTYIKANAYSFSETPTLYTGIVKNVGNR